jgi:hypothetical protein
VAFLQSLIAAWSLSFSSVGQDFSKDARFCCRRTPWCCPFLFFSLGLVWSCGPPCVVLIAEVRLTYITDFLSFSFLARLDRSFCTTFWSQDIMIYLVVRHVSRMQSVFSVAFFAYRTYSQYHRTTGTTPRLARSLAHSYSFVRLKLIFSVIAGLLQGYCKRYRQTVPNLDETK